MPYKDRSKHNEWKRRYEAANREAVNARGLINKRNSRAGTTQTRIDEAIEVYQIVKREAAKIRVKKFNQRPDYKQLKKDYEDFKRHGMKIAA